MKLKQFNKENHRRRFDSPWDLDTVLLGDLAALLARNRTADTVGNRAADLLRNKSAALTWHLLGHHLGHILTLSARNLGEKMF